MTGTFSCATSNLALLAPTLGYDANHLYIAMLPSGTTFAEVATTPNQAAVRTFYRLALGENKAIALRNTCYILAFPIWEKPVNCVASRCVH